MRYNVASFLENLFRPPADGDSGAPMQGEPVTNRIPAPRESNPAPIADPEIRVEDLDPDWRIAWVERAAVLEYDGGHPRERAEALALKEIIGQRRRAGVPPRR
jgi:hypothetical protein